MNTQNETQDVETTEESQSVGDIMQEGMQKALKKIVIGAGMLVYVAGIVYAEVHGLNILSKGVNPDFLIWAYIGMVALGISAIALPLALHVWAFEPMHRFATFAFYGVDLAILFINSSVDFNVNTGQQLAGWAKLYLDYILPATPVIAAAGWGVLLLLDPAVKAMILRQTLRASIQEAKASQIVNAAKNSNVTAAVSGAADAEVEQALTDLFGRKVTVKKQLTTSAPQLDGQRRGVWVPEDVYQDLEKKYPPYTEDAKPAQAN